MSKPKLDAKRVKPETLQKYLDVIGIVPQFHTEMGDIVREATVPEPLTGSQVCAEVILFANSRLSQAAVDALTKFLQGLNVE